MNIKKIKYKDLIAKFDQYEERFTVDLNDSFLIKFFDNFEQILIDSKFSPEQLVHIKSRLEKMIEMFQDKKQELKNKSINILEREQQLNRYVTNANLKSN